MTPEQLLKPRYKVIADYPGNELEVGTVIDNESAIRLQEHILSKYPNLFEKLEWWEEREKNDLPGYVKRKDNVFKIKHYGSSSKYYKQFAWYGDGKRFINLKSCLPATEQEYNEFIETLTHA